jgi:hypothetical protein
MAPEVGLLAPGLLGWQHSAAPSASPPSHHSDVTVASASLRVLETHFPDTVARPHRHLTDFPGKSLHSRSNLPPRGVFRIQLSGRV